MERIPTVEYPGYGKPCNGCGQCCMDQPCPVAIKFKTWVNGKCIALISKNGIYRCGMMIRPHKYSKLARNRRGLADKIKHDLGENTWCDARK